MELIEKKALELAVEAAGRRMQDYNIMSEENVLRQSIEAHARAIEQHEAFRREVSDAVEDYIRGYKTFSEMFDRFIIPQPDPLVEVMNAWWDADGYASIETFHAALAARGGRIVWEGE